MLPSVQGKSNRWYNLKLTSKSEELWSPTPQQIWPWNRSKVKVTLERACHNDHACHISMLYHFTSEDMSQVKVFVTYRRTDRRGYRTDRRTNEWVLMSPAFVKGGDKKIRKYCSQLRNLGDSWSICNAIPQVVQKIVCVSVGRLIQTTTKSPILVPGTGKSHQNTSAGKFDPERAVWNCWLLALLNDVIVYDVTTHATTLPATSTPLSMGLNVKTLNKFIFKTPNYFRYEKNKRGNI